MTPSIRPATPKDAAAIASVHVRTWQAAYRGLLPEDALAAMTAEQRRPTWDHRLAAPPPGHATFVAEADERVIGFSSVGRTRDAGDSRTASDTFEVFTLYVEPESQREGTGALLLREAEAAMRRAGAARGILWVLDGNEPAIRFYRKHGWLPTGEHKREALFGIDAQELLLTRDLADIT